MTDLFESMDDDDDEEAQEHTLGLGVVIWKDAFFDPNTRSLGTAIRIDSDGLTLATAGWLYEDNDGVAIVHDFMVREGQARHSQRIRRCDVVQVLHAEVSFTFDADGDVTFAKAEPRRSRRRPMGYLEERDPWSLQGIFSRISALGRRPHPTHAQRAGVAGPLCLPSTETNTMRRREPQPGRVTAGGWRASSPACRRSWCEASRTRGSPSSACRAGR